MTLIPQKKINAQVILQIIWLWKQMLLIYCMDIYSTEKGKCTSFNPTWCRWTIVSPKRIGIFHSYIPLWFLHKYLRLISFSPDHVPGHSGHELVKWQLWLIESSLLQRRPQIAIPHRRKTKHVHELTRQFGQPTRKVTHLFHRVMAPAEKIYLESTEIAPVIIIVTIVVGEAL